jgi:TetR/AcrR family transcriptional regulator, mexCD-oprJ operon repressor
VEATVTTADADRRRADAIRNREAILAAGFEVLSRQPDAGLTEIARVSGLTRTTVYAHFPAREDLLAELLRRAVQQAVHAIDTADPARGPAEAALQRVLAASWQQVASHAQLTEAIGHILGERAAELHAPVEQRLSELVKRGRRDGAFRRDVPVRWLLTVYFALVHAAGRDVATGTSTASQAERSLLPTLLGAFGAPTRVGGGGKMADPK